MWGRAAVVWASLGPGTVWAACPPGAPSLQAAAQGVQSAWVRHDTRGVRSAAVQLQLPVGRGVCAPVLSPADAASVHLSRALVGFLDEQPDRAAVELAAARRADPNWQAPSELAPPGGLVDSAMQQAPSTGVRTVRLRRGLLVDGSPARRLDPLLPAVVQQAAGPERSTETWWVEGEVPVTLRPAPARPATWLLAGGGLVALSVPALVLGEQARQDYRTTTDAAAAASLERWNRLAVTVGWSSLGAGLVSAGVGVGLR